MGEVINLSGPGLCSTNADFALKLRELANDVSDGLYGPVSSIVSAIELSNGRISEWVVAKQPIDNARAIGILTFGIRSFMEQT